MTTGLQRADARNRRAHKSGRLITGTERQKQILYCRCNRGLTNAETGEALCIAENTVKVHATALLKRLEVRTMCQACFRFGRLVGPEKEQTG